MYPLLNGLSVVLADAVEGPVEAGLPGVLHGLAKHFLEVGQSVFVRQAQLL